MASTGTLRRGNLHVVTKEDPVMRGWLEKKRSFGWHKRYFALERTMLCYYGGPTDSFPLGMLSCLACGANGRTELDVNDRLRIDERSTRY